MILITGGIKSGKSTLALDLARKFKSPRLFIATSEPLDPEMERKINAHKRSRGNGFVLREEPTEIFKPLKADKFNVCVIDCVTTWVGNLMHHGRDPEKYFDALVRALSGKEIIVTNEVGWGVIPADEASREYVNLLGSINKRLAARADEVYMMVSGLKVKIKRQQPAVSS